MSRLEAEGLSFAYVSGIPVLQGATLSLDEGEILFILGANGSGLRSGVPAGSPLPGPSGSLPPG